jgi:hypothetical protein
MEGKEVQELGEGMIRWGTLEFKGQVLNMQSDTVLCVCTSHLCVCTSYKAPLTSSDP